MKSWAYFQNDRKNKLLDTLQTGDLIKFKADLLPFISHYGIVKRTDDEVLFYHNQKDYMNLFGGSLVLENLSDYMKGREVIFIEKTRIDINDLEKITERLKHEKYDPIKYNCEHFTNQLTDKRFISPQVAKWGLILSLIGFGIIIAKHKK